MKKILFISMIGMLALASCSSNQSDTNNTVSVPSTTETDIVVPTESTTEQDLPENTTTQESPETTTENLPSQLTVTFKEIYPFLNDLKKEDVTAVEYSILNRTEDVINLGVNWYTDPVSMDKEDYEEFLDYLSETTLFYKKIIKLDGEYWPVKKIVITASGKTYELRYYDFLTYNCYTYVPETLFSFE